MWYARCLTAFAGWMVVAGCATMPDTSELTSYEAECVLKWWNTTSRTPTTDSIAALASATVDDKLGSAAVAVWGVKTMLRRVDRNRYVAACTSPDRLAVVTSETTDDQIRGELVAKDIADYPDNCPCPFSVDSLGRRCGERSAYVREKGVSLRCFPNDVKREDVRKFRDAEKNKTTRTERASQATGEAELPPHPRSSA